MVKKLLLVLSALILIVFGIGCDAVSPGYVNVQNTPKVSVVNTPTVKVVDTPPINVTGTFSGNVTSSGNTSIMQNVIVDPHNSSTTNLTAGATFTGTSTSTLGVNSIQVTLSTNQNCMVYVDQSPDGINWDLTATFDYIYSKGGYGWTIKAMSSYERVRVTNKNAFVGTTYFRLQTCLCPIAESIPFSTSADDRLKTETTLIDRYGFKAEFTPFNELRVAPAYKLAGTVFIGNTLDTNFVGTTILNGGTVTQNSGQMLVQTNTTANGFAQAFTNRRGRFIAGESNMAKLVVQLGDAGGADNVRRWGIGDLDTTQNVTDGAFYSINGTTFAVNTMRGGVVTTVSSGNFNGTYGSTYTLDTNEHVYEIYYSPYSVYFSLDGELLHTIIATTAPWTNTVTLYCGMDNRNSNSSIVNHIIYCRAFSISRLGSTESAPIYKYIASASTVICKYGAGRIHTIIIGSLSGNPTITVYDNTAGTGTIIFSASPSTNTVPNDIPMNCDFYTGLCIVTTGTITVSVIYE